VGDSVIYESGGNIGIGASPGTKLDVSGHIAANAGYLYTGDGSNGVVAARQGSLFVVSNGTGAVLINANGNYLYPGQVGGQGGTGGLSVYSGGAANTQQSQIGGTGNTWFNAGNVGIGNTTPTGKLVVNNNLAGNGSAGDGVSIYANTINSAVYAQQNNATGWSGYFSGRVNITGSLILGGRLKPVTINVCQVGTDTCLGEYLWTLNPSTTSAQYCYYTSPSASVPAACVNVFSGVPTNYCTAPDILINRTVAGRSLWSLSGCTGQEYQYPGYGAYGSGQACLDVDGPSGLSFTSYTSSGGCNVGGSVLSGYKVTGVLTQNTYSQAYELR